MRAQCCPSGCKVPRRFHGSFQQGPGRVSRQQRPVCLAERPGVMSCSWPSHEGGSDRSIPDRCSIRHVGIKIPARLVRGTRQSRQQDASNPDTPEHQAPSLRCSRGTRALARSESGVNT